MEGERRRERRERGRVREGEMEGERRRERRKRERGGRKREGQNDKESDPL